MTLERTPNGLWFAWGHLTIALSWFDRNWHLSIAWTV
jgi:hypothetical protein